MKSALLLAFLVLSTGSAFAGDRYIIKDDGGGIVTEYQQAIQYLKTEKIGLKIDGRCASACTLLLDKKAKLDICVTKNAAIAIHAPFAIMQTQTGIAPVFSVVTAAKADELLKKQFLDVYPKWLMKHLKGKRIPSVAMGDEPNDMIVVGFDILSKNMPVCKD